MQLPLAWPGPPATRDVEPQLVEAAQGHTSTGRCEVERLRVLAEVAATEVAFADLPLAKRERGPQLLD